LLSELLILQNARCIDVDRLSIAEKRYKYSEADGSLCRGDAHHHKDEKLSMNVGVVSRKRDERKIYGIEHKLDAHEHPESVALENNAYASDRKQNSR